LVTLKQATRRTSEARTMSDGGRTEAIVSIGFGACAILRESADCEMSKGQLNSLLTTELGRFEAILVLNELGGNWYIAAQK
jgi:hypothetical protein